VLTFVPLDSSVLFGVFLQVMHLRMFHYASNSDFVTDTICQSNAALSDVNFPRRAVLSNKEVFVAALGLRQTPGDRPVL